MKDKIKIEVSNIVYAFIGLLILVPMIFVLVILFTLIFNLQSQDEVFALFWLILFIISLSTLLENLTIFGKGLISFIIVKFKRRKQ